MKLIIQFKDPIPSTN